MKYILSLGTNIGDRKENLKKALKLLSSKFNILNVSTIYESEPWGMESEKNFYNVCVEIETDLKPIKLFESIEEIEKKMGRKDKGLKKDRIIDIDILLNENNIFLSEKLRIPHIFLKERKFYLMPLSEFDDEIFEPVSGKELKEIISECNDRYKVWKTGITLE